MFPQFMFSKPLNEMKENETKTLQLNFKNSEIIVPGTTIEGFKTKYRQDEQMLDIDVKQGKLPSPSGDISSLLEGQAFIHKNNELKYAI